MTLSPQSRQRLFESGTHRWRWLCNFESHHIPISSPSLPYTPHPLTPCPQPREFSFPAAKCPGKAGADSKMLWNVATQCWTNSITKASVTTHHLLFLGDFCQYCGVLTTPFSSSPLTPSNYMQRSLSITQWKRSSFWQENGEDWLRNKSCYKQHFLLREFEPGHLYESIYKDWKPTSFLNKPSDWQKTKILFSHSCH